MSGGEVSGDPPERGAPRPRSAVTRLSLRAFLVLGVALAVGLATAVSPYASSSPDGLERVAEDQAFLDRGKLHAVQEDSPAPAYAFPGVQDARVATGLAGFVGTLAVFVLAYGMAFALRRARRPGATA